MIQFELIKKTDTAVAEIMGKRAAKKKVAYDRHGCQRNITAKMK